MSLFQFTCLLGIEAVWNKNKKKASKIEETGTGNTRGYRHDPIVPRPPIEVNDDYFLWHRWANPGHHMSGNVYCFDFAMKHLPSDNPILEIGTFVGLSTNQITHCKRRHNRKNPLFTCDRWVFEGIDMSASVGGSPVTFQAYRELIKDMYVRLARTFSADDLPRTVELFSDEFFAAWERGDTLTDVFGNTHKLGGPLAFAFIDGDHSYAFAKRDFLNVDKFLEPGGFILFDDSADYARGPDGQQWPVVRVMEEVRQTGRYELVVRNPNYLWVKK
jgi:predicted O-methyltransferase YrrM